MTSALSKSPSGSRMTSGKRSCAPGRRIERPMTDLAIKPGAGTTPSAAPLQALKVETLAVRMRRRKRLVLALRLGLLVAMIGGWELAARVGLIDPFFFGQPSLIVDK